MRRKATVIFILMGLFVSVYYTNAATKDWVPSLKCGPGIVFTRVGPAIEWLCFEYVAGCYVTCKYVCTYESEGHRYTFVFRCREGLWQFPSLVCLRRPYGVRSCNDPQDLFLLCNQQFSVLQQIYCESCEDFDSGDIFCAQVLTIEPRILAPGQ